MSSIRCASNASKPASLEPPLNPSLPLRGSPRLTRRAFVQGAAASTSLALLPGCSKASSPTAATVAPPPPATPSAAPASPAEGRSRDEILALVENRADDYMRACHHCAQASFLTLQEIFGLEGGTAVVRALTPLPGVAERGETCGAVTGCLLALGLVFGRDRLDDWAGWRSCLVPARAFCADFETALGSTQCGDIVERLFGERYDLADPVQLGKFQQADPTSKCGSVVRQAVRLAAGRILDPR